jgi:cell division protein FtsI (penicillin-binding protein 3)
MNNWISNRVFGFSIYQGCQTGDTVGWGASRAVLDKTRSRMGFMAFVLIALYAVVGARVAHVTMTGVGNDHVVALDETQKPVTMRRADITDRDGRLLATSLQTSSLYADPKNITDAPDVARKLTHIFPDLSYATILEKLQSKRRFVWLKRNLTPRQVYLANALGIPGIDFINETRRLYPQGNLMAHAVGYTDVDQRGLAGLERGLDGMLRDADRPVHTTLDVRFQHILIKHLKTAIHDFRALGGAGLIMDAKTGEIYALASLPDFNPHDTEKGPAQNRFNRVTLGAYEMGSTFKTFTTAAMLERMRATVSTRFDATQPIKRAGFTIRDFHPEKRALSVAEIYVHSSNIGTALMAEKLGTSELKSFFGKLGLFDKPQIEIKEVASPIIPQPWRDINTITAAYGHGIAVTPLQLASATATIVNGGLRVTPTLIKRDIDAHANEGERVISEKTAATMRDLMRLVVTDGTATKANAVGYRVGGKTGTAEKTLGRGYSTKAQIASFVGAFPIENPRFIVMAMVDEPKGNDESYGYATAGWVSAPVVGHVIRDIAPLAGIAPQSDTRLPHIKAAMGFLPQPHSLGGRLASY